MSDRLNNTLNKIEQLIGTDVKYLIQGGSKLSFIKIITASASFILAIVFANFFPAEAYGNYKYVMSLAGVIGAFSLTGITTATVQSVAREKEGIYRKGFVLSILWSIPVIIISLFGSIYYYLNENILLSVSMLAIAIFIPLNNGALLYRFFLIGKKDFTTLSKYSFFYSTIPVALVIITIFNTNNFIFPVLIYLAGDTITSLILYFRVLKKNNPNNNFDKESVVYSKHLSLINILDIVATNIDKILLFQWLGATQLAIYSFATAIPEQMRSVVKMIATLALPKFANREFSDIQKTIFSKIYKLFLVTIPLAIVYIILAPLIFDIVFPKYTDAVFYSQMFTLIVLVEGGLAGTVFKAKLMIKESYISNISTNIFKIVLVFVGLSIWGLWGLIVARLLSRLFSFLLSFFLLKNKAPNNL